MGLLDAAGRQTASYTYDVWGHVTSIGGASPDVGRQNPLRYRSYYQDAETGYYYVNGDYYNPLWGDWLQGEDAAGTSSNIMAFASKKTISIKDILLDIFHIGKDKIYLAGQTVLLTMKCPIAANMWAHAFWGYGIQFRYIPMYEKAWSVLQNTVETNIREYAATKDSSRRWTSVIQPNPKKPTEMNSYNFDSGDLFYALGAVNLKIVITNIPTEHERRAYYHITVSDMYDFSETRVLEKILEAEFPSFGDFANDFGLFLQWTGYIQMYKWEFNQSGSVFF